MRYITGYEGLYSVTEDGRVYSHKRHKFLKLITQKNGYIRVELYNNKKRRFYLVHRLVAQAYIPNPDNLLEVNHKSEIKSDNSVGNLEWCTRSYNNTFGTRQQRAAETLSKDKSKLIEKIAEKNRKLIYCVELDRTFKGLKEAAQALGLSVSNISWAVTGRSKTAGGYHWQYA